MSSDFNLVPFSVLASEFNVESKNMNCFAGECQDIFGQNSKGGLCQTSTQKLTDRYLVDFGFEGIIWATLTREKNIFPFAHQ